MSGKRWDPFRSGDRSEYLARFGLSRIAFVSPIPRQEDFGVVDFLCMLTLQDPGKAIYPENAFYVQVKSSKKDLHYKSDPIRWITHHMDHPLLLCIADKSESKLTFYSLSRIWQVLFLRSEPESISLKPDRNDDPSEPFIERTKKGKPHFDVMLGPPIFSQDLDALEKDPSVAYKILKAWIQMDAKNIARRRTGRLFFQSFRDWQTNVVPKQVFWSRYYFGPNYRNAEPEFANQLMAFGINYERSQDAEKLKAVCEMLHLLRPHLGPWEQEFLNKHRPGPREK